jgi:hypothetical protein
MLGVTKSTFGFNEAEASKGMFFALAMQFEQFSGDRAHILKNETLEMAFRLRDIMTLHCMQLKRSDMLAMYKSINRAKVRALAVGNVDGYKVFRMLDSISGDISKMIL